jgi:class 3 adenylate cyclase
MFERAVPLIHGHGGHVDKFVGDGAAAMGDRQWSELLEGHHKLVRQQLQRFGGHEIKTTGDGFLATFDGPAGAIRCALATIEATHEIDVTLRAGLHTGECERRHGDISGIAVHTGARVAALAEPGEVLVSRTVKDLVAGSGLAFEERGNHTLKGIPDEWRLFAVSSSRARIPVGRSRRRRARTAAIAAPVHRLASWPLIRQERERGPACRC